MDTNNLNPGDNHYRAYIGIAEQYDFMGATQFNLCFSLGLREKHKLLDLGCGSLRAGKFFISYLNKGNYYGIDPNEWLIEEAIEKEIGQDLINIKSPSFNHNNEFKLDVFNEKFDFIIAQSIFSHTGIDIVEKSVERFSEQLTTGGIALITFVNGLTDTTEEGWIYPKCVEFKKKTIINFAKKNHLYCKKLNWHHPRQSWFIFSKDKKTIPNLFQSHMLRGTVLFDTELKTNFKLKLKRKIKQYLNKYFRKHND
jgi:ubiquinone/menaquinone biosynthesis C-methylase UbiE